MGDDRQLVARISAELSASTGLTEVCAWLIESRHHPVRLEAGHLPALGRRSWLSVARPITAPRAVLCTLWLLDELERGSCLVAGKLRFVGHPTASDVRMSFDGRAIRTGHGDNAARQLLEVIVASIEKTAARTIRLTAAG
ncbi:MAG TPA: hypothetical protein VKF16_12205 [Candidatus Dormibacteraeota bacterium]|nr:hypothetical protein [Candidatus Dormibacteraeota bacterium]